MLHDPQELTPRRQRPPAETGRLPHPHGAHRGCTARLRDHAASRRAIERPGAARGGLALSAHRADDRGGADR